MYTCERSEKDIKEKNNQKLCFNLIKISIELQLYRSTLFCQTCFEKHIK